MADVMREYLVSLGFSVDQAKLRTFNDALKGTSQSMAKLGAEVIGTGIALTAMVDTVARQFADLYYVSQRTGATINSLDAVGFAAQQVGLSAEEARGSIEGFASAIRRNPGLAAFYQGITGRRPTGRSDEDQRNLVRSLSKKPDFVALPQAALFGMDEHTYLQMKNNMSEFDRDMADHLARMKAAGLNLDEDKEKWVEFTRVMNHFGDQFSVAGARIAEDWRGPLQELVKGLDEVVGRFGAADVASQGVIGKVTGLIGAFGGITAVLALLGKLFGFRTGIGLAAGTAASIPALLETIKTDTQTEGQPLRTGLRALFGIEDPHESGQFGVRPPENPNASTWYPSTNTSFVPWKFGTPTKQPPVDPTKPFGGADPGPDGLFDVPATGKGKTGGNVTINQSNQFGDVRDLEMTIDRVKDTNRELGNALRNTAAKMQ